ncbi:helix-turn-helix domain-containing protein [Streptomyces sp. TRM66268-LWL]|uniref:Helix-turn-helix domain-containing protein n=1 Tax=Streptomyces polyasparticus TaxID=2767826 RepID=A0ABR7SQQ4_9ACTN|nr:helix-turn-helix transcriptional regulator [Streptomyces polyasparticus]MBC9717224.1 helix-turn-helix domain-containing protein [Streptomyces polyasparticus]
MGSWQPLPEAYPAEVVHFIEQLRLLKDRTGMSLVALGARTAYSKSSWQRYLNGQQPPPRKAVLALCRVAGLDAAEAARFGARWELALRAWPRPDAVRPRLADAVRSDGARPDAVRGDAGAASALGERDDYDSDDPDTLPWWIPLDEPGPERAPSWRVLTYGAAAALVILLAALLFLLT